MNEFDAEFIQRKLTYILIMEEHGCMMLHNPTFLSEAIKQIVFAKAHIEHIKCFKPG